ncbi:hypothetical protein ABZ638_11305 [Streptomyces sp. NPDC007107]|uniref:hypothetical protein n=1 Tax=Streptomyces sp. NPDC007107 TaxID=3156915 RepID=UPI0034102A5F
MKVSMFDEVDGADEMDGVSGDGVTGRLRSRRPKVPTGPEGRTARADRPGRTVVSLLVLPLLGALVLVLGPTGPAPAQAASACSGRLVKTVTFSTGSLRVYKSRAYACAVAVAKKPGARRAMRVSLQPRGGRAVVDSGSFTKLAGPVTVHALNRCVRASGSVGGSSGSTGWILC